MLTAQFNHLEKWEGKKRSGKPPGIYDRRRKVFVPSESLQVKMAKCCVSNGTETHGTHLLSCFLEMPRWSRSKCLGFCAISPAQSSAQVILGVHFSLALLFWTREMGIMFSVSLPCLSATLLSDTVHGITCSPPQKQELVGLILLYCWSLIQSVCVLI